MSAENRRSIEEQVEDLKASGWALAEDATFPAVGPLWYKCEADEYYQAFIAQPQHMNRKGTIHGGMIATIADYALGRAARRNNEARLHATIELNIHFIDAGRLNDLIVARARIMRETSSVVFVDGVVETDGKILAKVSGIWKIQGRKN